jgi:DNA adenine methylase
VIIDYPNHVSAMVRAVNASSQLIELRDEKIHPFLKWAGGKARLASSIVSLVPRSYRKYIEPFVGGGAIFFATCPVSAVLSDSNDELINCYEVVRNSCSELVDSLKSLSGMKYCAESYYSLRSQKIPSSDKIKRAARLIYLNRTSFNGLYRVNRKGDYNTPFGSYRTLSLPARESLFKANHVLQNASLRTGDFEDVLLKNAERGDFVYLDPPYPPVGKYSDFNRYTMNFFQPEDHARLARTIKELDEIGCKFILSNAEHPLIRELYNESKFRILKVSAPRFINCKGNKRRNVPELLITNCGN